MVTYNPWMPKYRIVELADNSFAIELQFSNGWFKLGKLGFTETSEFPVKYYSNFDKAHKVLLSFKKNDEKENKEREVRRKKLKVIKIYHEDDIFND